MTVNKLTTPPSQNGVINKINEIIDNLGGGGTTEYVRNIGEIVQSTIPLTDSGLHLLDGTLISGSGSYGDFVTYIAGLVSDYPDLFDTEANWQSSVSTYGVCGKFVYDSVNNTVRLPKITGFTEGTTDVNALGDLIEAGLPNITGSIGGIGTELYDNSTGAFYTLTNTTNKSISTNTNSRRIVAFDSSRSSSVYGNSNTVQPQSIKVLYYIVVATTTKTEIEVDIDEIATDLNGKAGTDLANINATGQITIAHNAMPSTTYDDLTAGASGTTYTAPADGYFFLRGEGGDGTHIAMFYSSSLYFGMRAEIAGGSAHNAYIFLPAKKGQVIQLSYSVATILNFRFFYAVGSESEQG